MRGRGGDGARADDTDPPGWRVNGRDVVDDDSSAPSDVDYDLRDRWRLARWLPVGPLALAAIVLPDEDAPVADRQAHKNTCFHTETLRNAYLLLPWRCINRSPTEARCWSSIDCAR
jgi:hypothetical protein